MTTRDFYMLLNQDDDLTRLGVTLDFSGCNDCSMCPYNGDECHGCSREWMLNDDGYYNPLYE